MTDYLIGIDVSSNNSSDWEDDAWDYCWVKATEGGTYKNPEYERQLEVVRSRGKVVGHYHWLNSRTLQEQIDWFVEQADVQAGEMIACDWEDSSNPSCKMKDDWIKKIQVLFPDNKVGLYCNKDWWINKDTTSFYGDYLWIANYTSASDPGIQADWTFWQYTSSPYDKNRGKFADLDALKEWAGLEPAPPDPEPPSGGGGAWFSTDYLFPQVKPDPTNPNGVKKGDVVEVTADGGLTARTLPGGPKSVDKYGEVVVREKGYSFDITGDLVDGWVTGGTNWYSSDYLKKQEAPAKPGWKSSPYKVFPMTNVPGSVSYLQGICRVDPVTTDDGTKYGAYWIIAQDYENEGDIRFLCFNDSGGFVNWMQVNDAGHGQTFYAYRSAAGNLYVWCGEDPAYRYSWQPGKKVSRSSGTKMDYKGARPQGGYKDRIAFRNANDTHETFYLFDRTDFTDGSNRTNPLKTSPSIAKDTSPTQQGWWSDDKRIYRFRGKTNEDSEHSHSGLHMFDVIDWSGKFLLRDLDLTNMHRSGCPEDEPEGGVVFSSGGLVLAGKREGPASASKRAYVLWEMINLP